MKEHKIRKIGLFPLLCYTFFLSHFFFLFYGRNIILISQNDTILSCLVGMIFNLLLFSLLLKIRKKEITIPSKMKKGIALFLSILLLFLLIIILKDAVYFVKMHYLPEGHFFSLFLLFLILTLIISNRNISSVTSLAFLLFFLFVPLFLSSFIGSFPLFNLSYLKPLITTNFKTILEGALLFSFYTMTPLLLLLFVPYHTIVQKEKQNKYLYFALILSNLCTLLGYFMILFGTSFTYGATYEFPFMILVRKVSGFLNFNRFYYLFSPYLLFDCIIFLGGIVTTLKSQLLLLFPKRKR